MSFVSKCRAAALHRAAIFGAGIGVGMSFSVTQDSPLLVQVVFVVSTGLPIWALAAAGVMFYGWFYRKWMQ